MRWDKQITFAKTEQVLSFGKVVNIRELKDALVQDGKRPSGSHLALLLTLADGTRGIFKFGSEGEIAAYQVMRRLLKGRLIPPTVARDLGPELMAVRSSLNFNVPASTVGSLQYFVSTRIDLKDPNQWASIWPSVSPKQISDRDVFYFVFGQWDRHRGNILADDAMNLALIDNEGIRTQQYVRYGENPFLLKIGGPIQPDSASVFPYQRAELFDHPEIEDLRSYLSGKVDVNSMERFLKSMVDRKDRTCKIVIWRGRAWVQSIGYSNYGPIQFDSLSESTLTSYAALTFESLREILPANSFPDDRVWQILDARNELLSATRAIPKMP